MIAMKMDGRHFNRTALLLLLLLFAGCATVENHYDPIEGVNRVTDRVNEGLDRISLKPLARGYVWATNDWIRAGISNFYDNAQYPNTIINQFMQGKVKEGFSDLGRLLINSTVGLLGFIDVADMIGLHKHEEDFGQTLAVWGVPQGAYIVYPFFGPNSLRNTPDLITETAVSGLFWAGLFLQPQVTIPLSVFYYIDKRARLLDASDLRDELSLDPYIFTREAWMQRREYLIHDGKSEPLVEKSISTTNDDEGWGDEPANEEDDWSDEPPAP